jgi:hypothetical protein
VLVHDETEVLAGEIGPGDAALTVRTRQRLLVELSAWYIRHSIALAGVVSDLGSQLADMLSPQTLASLASLGPGGYSQNEEGTRSEEGGEDADGQGAEDVTNAPGAEAGWLEYMQRALNRR